MLTGCGRCQIKFQKIGLQAQSCIDMTEEFFLSTRGNVSGLLDARQIYSEEVNIFIHSMPRRY